MGVGNLICGSCAFSFLTFYLFIFGCAGSLLLCAHWLSLVATSGATLWLQCSGFSLWWLLLLQSTGSGARELQWLRRVGSVVVLNGLSCSVACEIFSDRGLNLWPLHWPVDSLPLSHQGSPPLSFVNPVCTSGSSQFTYC